jgi:hypothetical protein
VLERGSSLWISKYVTLLSPMQKFFGIFFEESIANEVRRVFGSDLGD